MNTPSRTHRFAVAIVSAVTTLALFSAVVGAAQPPVAGSLFAQASATQAA